MLADDHGVVRSGLKRALEESPGFTIVGEASNAAEMIQLAPKLKPDVLILDIGLPDISGLHALRQLKRKSYSPVTLVVSMHVETAYVAEAIKLGVQGYVDKSAPTDTIIEATKRVVEGGSFFYPPELEGKAQDFLATQAAGGPFALLTPRERDVVGLLEHGMTNAEIAKTLGISHRTVEIHRAHIMSKLGFANKAQLFKFLAQNSVSRSSPALDADG